MNGRRGTTTCHPGRRHHSLGLCEPCYHARRYQLKKEARRHYFADRYDLKHPNSTPRASTIADEVRKAISVRGTTPSAVARAVGVGVSTVHGIVRYGKTPTYATAVALAEHLGWQRIVALAAAARTRKCPVCDKSFMSAHEKVATFCSRRCRVVARQRRLREHGASLARIAKNRLTEYQDAVAAFCVACEPDRICRDSECALRSVSPLPLITVTRRVA